jgi:class 3 adenylate cyclase/TM2 domain-containing membrane protein YozV
MKSKERRLAAIMFTDIVGYSSMMQKDEDLANRMRVRHREVFNRLHDQYGGKILQYFGDGTLSIFPSTTAAVECAVALQQALKKEPQVPIRIGIHTGDIIYSDEEAYGDGVNIAARIEGLCVPGGVFLSGKTYDDIKNHPRLRAKSMGKFHLKNIQQDIEVYAVSNGGVTAPTYEWQAQQSPGKPVFRKKLKLAGRKKKWVASLLALFFGIFGAHRFYLEQRNYGVLYLAMFILGALILDIGQLVAIPAILGFIDFISFVSMSRDTFDTKFNQDIIQAEEALHRKREEEAQDPKRILHKQFDQYIQAAQKEYSNYDYEDAIAQLLRAIEIKYDDPEAHYLLARCYSINEQVEKSLSHLDVAVAFGLKNPEERIKTEGDLAYLRIRPEFEDFTRNGYRLPRELPPPKPEWIDPDDQDEPDLLEQLNRLQKQWREGELTDEEYELRQQELRRED